MGADRQLWRPSRLVGALLRARALLVALHATLRYSGPDQLSWFAP